MSGQLLSFDFRASQVRVVQRAGQAWFVARDVCDVLGIVNYRDAIRMLDDDEKGVGTTDTPGGTQHMSIVSESGLYALIFTSRKAEARAFRRWVTGEVLPALRRDGHYERDEGDAGPFGTRPGTRDMQAMAGMLREARLAAGKGAATALLTRFFPDIDLQAGSSRSAGHDKEVPAGACADPEPDEFAPFFGQWQAAGWVAARSAYQAYVEWCAHEGLAARSEKAFALGARRWCERRKTAQSMTYRLLRPDERPGAG